MIPSVYWIERIISQGSTLLCNIEAIAGNDTSTVAKCFKRDLGCCAVVQTAKRYGFKKKVTQSCEFKSVAQEVEVVEGFNPHVRSAVH